jgi:hypothetical protein
MAHLSRNREMVTSYWKRSSTGDPSGDPMTTIDKDDARHEAVLSLRKIAASCLKFAGEAGNPTVLEARLRLAAKLEKEAAALEAASNEHS